MDIRIDIPLGFTWSITSKGELMVELVKDGPDGETMTDFVFDKDTLLGSLNDDIGMKYLDPSTSVDDWFDLAAGLKDLSESITNKLKESFK